METVDHGSAVAITMDRGDAVEPIRHAVERGMVRRARVNLFRIAPGERSFVASITPKLGVRSMRGFQVHETAERAILDVMGAVRRDLEAQS